MPTLQVKDATGATQTIQTLPAVGQAAMLNSLPVVLASDQASIPVSLAAGANVVGTVFAGNSPTAHALPTNEWQMTATLIDAASHSIQGAGAGSLRNYLSAIQYQNTNATATTITILDGTTAIWTCQATANMAQPAVIAFPTPLRGTAVTAMNVQCGTTGANVLVNAQGFQAN